MQCIEHVQLYSTMSVHLYAFRHKEGQLKSCLYKVRTYTPFEPGE